MDAIAKLQDLYALRDRTNEQIAAIEQLLGADPTEAKVRRKRGPNKPKEPPPNAL
jgi:hypothetical protein